uniref:tRNA pseudouridine(55) synthase n=1 Tax=Romanomermis culicivorax TaxID=13658 RepID=A0A915IMM0_ROMCU
MFRLAPKRGNHSTGPGPETTLEKNYCGKTCNFLALTDMNCGHSFRWHKLPEDPGNQLEIQAEKVYLTSIAFIFSQETMDYLCRACHIRSKNEFSIVSRVVLNIFVENPSSSDTFTCQCCLGLLQPSIAQQFLQTAKKSWEEENYDSRSFNLCISFPLSVMIRDKILQLSVHSNTDIMFSTLKDVCKFCYRSQLESVLGLEGDSGSDFSINLNFKQIDLDGKDLEQIKELFELECISKKRKTVDDSSVSRVVLTKSLDRIDEITIKRLFNDYAYFQRELITPCELDVHFVRLPLFIGGSMSV